MHFIADTYICLDMPMPIAQQIIDIRVHFGDTFCASLPAEITLAGSGGVGILDTTQDEKLVFDLLDTIAVETEPIEAMLGKVMRFPKTDIFVFTLTNEQPFRALHKRIVSSPICFQPSPFPYTPHCTLSSRFPISEEEAAELLSLRISSPFVLDTLSVYMLDRLPMALLHRVKLTGN